jgi:hypothetical protein
MLKINISIFAYGIAVYADIDRPGSIFAGIVNISRTC